MWCRPKDTSIPIELFIESLSNRSLFRSVYMRFDLDLMFI